MSTPEIQLFELDDPGRCSVGFGLGLAFTPTWYKLRVRTKSGFGAWEHTAEIIMDWEVALWVEWLRDAVRKAHENELDARLQAFPEKPLARFVLCETDVEVDIAAWGGGWVRLRVMLRYGYDPTSRFFDREFETPFLLDMFLPATQLNGLADHLVQQAVTSKK